MNLPFPASPRPVGDAPRRAQAILAYFDAWNLDRESVAFLRYHYRRYEFLLNKIDPLVTDRLTDERQPPFKILDIGPGFQTELLRQIWPEVVVNTLGFRDRRFQPRLPERHFEFNLNDAQFKDKWPVLESHDLVIMAEVIEHLYTAPSLVLACVATWLKAGGYLVLQTPNACALHKRLKMLAGKNPYDLIRETHDNPGHFREYTLRELFAYSIQSGFAPVACAAGNYFDNGSRVHKLYNALSRILPTTLRQGLTLTLQKVR